MHTLPSRLLPFIFHFIKKRPLAFSVFFLAPTLIPLEANVLPYALKMIIDGLTQHGGNRNAIFEHLAPAFWLGGSCWLTLVIGFRIQHWWQSRVIPQFEADIRMSVVDYVTKHSHSYFANQLSGTLANKIADLPRAIEAIRQITCWNLISSSAVVIVGLILISTVDPLFSFILSGWVTVHLISIFIMARLVHQASEINAEDKSTLTGIIVDIIANIVPVKLFARRIYELSYIGKQQAIEKQSNRKLIFNTNLLLFCMDIPVTFALGFTVYFLITGWQQEHITTGDIVFVFNTYWAITFHMWMLGQALTNLFREVGIAKQALSLVVVPHGIKDARSAKKLEVTKGKIEFKRVTFRYKRNDNLFENKSVTIKAGSKVGLVGFSGSGKTTFVNLILRFFDIHAGTILIDGQDISNVTQNSLHEAIAVIPQDTNLFHRNLSENIRYGRLDATDEEVLEASKNAHCHEFIAKLPEGYSTMVGERGIKLSGGQRQRIAVARAMLKNAPILILDEATSALDSMTEKHIQKSLNSLMQNRTTIVIAHRLSTLSEMDRILVFDKGHIIEDGTHKELLKAKGHYAKLWHMQAGGFLPEKEEE